AYAGEERELVGGATARALALTLAFAAGGTLVAPQIIALGFGAEYAASASVLQILLWSVPFSTLKLIPWVGLIAHEQGHRATGPMAWAVVVNLVLNTLLVPRFGVTGAAVATVATEIACWAMMYHQAVSAGVAPMAVRRIWKPLTAAACMAGVLLIMPDLHLFAGIGVGALSFAAALAVLRGIHWRRGMPSLDL
ncbi:MAG: polysaccharide biosynthesis C-terminal domain-containing protein, partial [Longimicrobiales bacterium]